MDEAATVAEPRLLMADCKHTLLNENTTPRSPVGSPTRKMRLKKKGVTRNFQNSSLKGPTSCNSM